LGLRPSLSSKIDIVSTRNAPHDNVDGNYSRNLLTNTLVLVGNSRASGVVGFAFEMILLDLGAGLEGIGLESVTELVGSALSVAVGGMS